MIYDCFPFFNELDLLEIRLNELAPVVDKFVLAEATRTHSNRSKPLYFAENKLRFKPFLDKIIHIVVDDFPPFDGNRWVLENYQRNALQRGLNNCRADDVIILSDLDEIVRPEAILEYRDQPGVKIFRQRMFYYYLNCECYSQSWTAAKMVNYRYLRSPQWLRDYPRSSRVRISPLRRFVYRWGDRIRRVKIGPDIVIPDGGWHFSYLGGADAVLTKIQAFAHGEVDNESIANPEHIRRALEMSTDIYGRDDTKFDLVSLDSSFPRYVYSNPERFSNFTRHRAIETALLS